jgi:hypothetical protein
MCGQPPHDAADAVRLRGMATMAISRLLGCVRGGQALAKTMLDLRATTTATPSGAVPLSF